MDAGILRIPSEKPEKELELWGCEASAACRRVREVLSSLELPYELHTTAVGSGKECPVPAGQPRRLLSQMFEFLQFASAFPVFFRDPNTGKELDSSEEIVKYLRETYQRGQAPQETWLMYGKGQATTD